MLYRSDNLVPFNGAVIPLAPGTALVCCTDTKTGETPHHEGTAAAYRRAEWWLAPVAFLAVRDGLPYYYTADGYVGCLGDPDGNVDGIVMPTPGGWRVHLVDDLASCDPTLVFLAPVSDDEIIRAIRAKFISNAV